MGYKIRYTKQAKEDLKKLFAFLLEKDLTAAQKARDAIQKSIHVLEDFPFSCRKIQPETPFLREIIIPFGTHGYVALFEIENDYTVTILAVRHQLEEDYY